jgi:signal recognition particle subunit SRP54|tara:strand:- start:8 stop:1483 length:1476 start_codon:yes stop_codon:yes gene_type:complete
MVLADLGTRITNALQSLNRSTVIDDETVKKMVNEIVAALLAADVNFKQVVRLKNAISTALQIEDAAGVNRRKLIRQTVFNELVEMLESDRKPHVFKKGKSNVVMFVGLQGSGKTTTIAKYAHHYARKGWKCAMVCADTFRAGAFDQLKQNAARVRVPFYGSYTEADPVVIADDGVRQFKEEGVEIIIVDTSGRNKQDTDLFEEMKAVEIAVDPDEIIFVLDSTIGQMAAEQANAFADAVEIGSVIMTKLDGGAKGGGALSAVGASSAPIAFIGTGEHFDDLEVFEAKSFVKRLLGMGDIEGLMDVAKQSGILDKQPEMLERFSRGQFTLRDMYEQFQNVMKLGPLSRVMSMIPGLPQMAQKAGGEKEGANRIRRFMFMMDSMNDAELDGKNIHQDGPAIMRIARGSGTAPEEVHALLQYHKQMEKMVGKMGKTSLMKGDKKLNSQIGRNPQAVMQQLSQSIDPRMLQQMGGAKNMMEMMKKMGGMGMEGLM